MRKFLRLNILWASVLWGTDAVAAEVSEVLPPLPVSKYNVNVFSTPVAYYQGQVYTVNVEPAVGEDTGRNLRTVVRKGTLSSGRWVWEAYVLNSTTLADPYHTQGSIAVDKNGYVHVAYNMHNMPWQYSVSKLPRDIRSGFDFLGEPVSDAELYAVKNLNKTPFPWLGNAKVPGNQVTYPAFFHDRSGNLYLTYRYAVRPKRAFKERDFSAGIARYDTATRSWSHAGGQTEVTTADAVLADGKSFDYTWPFAMQRDWAVYLPRLWFDKSNTMHVAWLWRYGSAGADASHPSYARSFDAGRNFQRANSVPYQLPITVADSAGPRGKDPEKKYLAPLSLTADSAGNPSVLLQEYQGSRVIVRYDNATKTWTEPVKTPYAATLIVNDDSGSFWAFASGIKIFRSEERWPPSWKPVSSDQDYCYPKVYMVPEERTMFLHSQSCALGRVKIQKITY